MNDKNKKRLIAETLLELEKLGIKKCSPQYKEKFDEIYAELEEAYNDAKSSDPNYFAYND